MKNALLILLLVPAALSIWALVAPESAWRATSAWKYRNPAAHEPSQAGYAVQRVGGVLGLIMTAVLAVLILSLPGQDPGRQQREDYQACLDRHEGEDSLLTPERWCENLSPSP